MNESLRTWLIAALNHRDLPPIAVSDWPNLIAQAEAEGVLVMLEHRLAGHPDSTTVPPDLLSQIQHAAKQGLMEQLPFHAEQKKIYQALNQAKIPFLVLKGAALGQWLYTSPALRPITDIDLWFSDAAAVLALAKVLMPLGYELLESGGELTTFQRAYDKTINGCNIRIDAHWTLFNSALLANIVPFNAAFARSQSFSMHGQAFKALSHEDALINAIGHRALKQLSGQANTLKWLYDQYLLFNTLDTEQWQQLLGKCAEAGISDLMLEALEQSVNTFNTHIPANVMDALLNNAKHEKIQRTWFTSWSRYQWQEMHAVSPKLSVRLRWLAQKLAPNPEAMREGYGQNDSAWRFMLRRFGVGIRRLFS